MMACYVLSAIGQYQHDDEYVTRLVQRAFGGGPDWRATLRLKLCWPDTIDRSIQRGWQQFQKRAAEHGRAAKPEAFAEAYSAEFSGL